MKRHFRHGLAALLLLAALGPIQVRAESMSVQVRNGQMRATPSFLGRVLEAAQYGDRVEVLKKQNEWIEVRKIDGTTGWMHQSALTKKTIVIKAGAEDVQAAASGRELALAGKGFNADVEADFKKKNANVDFTWIDRMEKVRYSAQDGLDFLSEGGVKPPTGGGQ